METEYGTLHFEPLTRFNWEVYANLQPAKDQALYLPTNLYSIAQSKFEAFDLQGILLNNTPVGFAMTHQNNGICWITRIMIDEQYQGKRLGEKALKLLLEKLKNSYSCHEVRTSIDKRNGLAEHIFCQAGFERMSEMGQDGEIFLILKETKR